MTASASCSTHILGIPGLSLVKSAPSTATSGSILTYTINYKNSGTTVITGITITDTIPSGFSPIGPTTWNIGTLEPGSGGSVSLSGTVTALGSDTLINEAVI
ncbi:DUF11 domain-containing protein, partial [bacterium]|nr:DUF11 domain-containing protein [bacterium]